MVIKKHRFILWVFCSKFNYIISMLVDLLQCRRVIDKNSSDFAIFDVRLLPNKDYITIKNVRKTLVF